MTVPAKIAAACGVDAFVHAEEAYVSKMANPFTDAMAEKAMEPHRRQHPPVCRLPR